jgi:hypothetical protein
MYMRHVIKFDTPADDQVEELLIGEGAAPDVYHTDWQIPTQAAFTRIEARLNKSGTPFDVFFELHPNPDEDPRNYAAYLPLKYLADVTVTQGDLILAREDKAFMTVASKGVIEILEQTSKALNWHPFEGHDGMFVMTNSFELPQPIILPRVVWLSQSDTTGNWAAQSDGRELLTAENLRIVQEHGIVHSSHFRTDDRVLPWNHVLIFSGPILKHLLGHGVQGIVAPPIFLGPE